jgi:TolB-like protein/Flp pilus assembly protein TadD
MESIGTETAPERQKRWVNLTVYSFVVNDLDASAIRGQLDRILASGGFKDAGRIGPLLRFLVEKTLSGQTESIKESVLGVEVFQRSADYDPRTDPIVRVDARRLRARLEEYYKANPGESVLISLPKGGYVPVFEARRRAAHEPPLRFHMSGPALVFIMVTIMSFGIGLFLYLGNKSKKQTKPAIAVLPFRNLSADPDNQYFSDGLTIELIEALTRIENLSVVSWNSAARFRGKAESLNELRTRLNAAAVLDGSVRKQGDKIRVTAQLVDTAKGSTIWSQTWDKESKDVFRIQEEIAKSIVYGLRVQMNADPDLVLLPAVAKNPEAYNDYLRARFHRNQFSDEGLRLSSEYANRAIDKDPAYAPPYALLAGNIVLNGYYKKLPASEASMRAKEIAGKAIALDARNAEGHAAMGMALSMGEWKFAEARTHFLKAIELNPGSSDARSVYALGYLLPNARLIEAEFEVKRSVELDPLSFLSNFLAGYVLQQTPGKEAEAVRFYDKAIEIFPAFNDLIWDRGMALAFAGRKDDAMAAFRKRGELAKTANWIPGCVEWALLGDKQKAQEMITRQELSALEHARAHALIGEVDQAIANLNRAFEERDPQLMFLKVDRRLTNLRSDKRFQELVRKVGL